MLVYIDGVRRAVISFCVDSVDVSQIAKRQLARPQDGLGRTLTTKLTKQGDRCLEYRFEAGVS